VFVPGEVVSYLDMCREEGISLQRGMNFGQRDTASVILMSRRVGAPYEDRVEEDGKVLIYEGHDQPQVRGGPSPKTLDQVERTAAGTLTQNGLFLCAAARHRTEGGPATRVRVYEKMRTGIWVFNGIFALVDGWATSIYLTAWVSASDRWAVNHRRFGLPLGHRLAVGATKRHRGSTYPPISGGGALTQRDVRAFPADARKVRARRGTAGSR
jgi:hypothetical protein